MNLPLIFISFGIVKGKLFQHLHNDGTFITTYGAPWGNDVVYGAIFAIEEFDFYIRLLDAYHQCSISTLNTNHKMDLHHRHVKSVVPIEFDSLDSLERLMYTEKPAIEAFVYIGNTDHSNIQRRLRSTISYRIIDGVDENFIKLYREVNHGEEHV